MKHHVIRTILSAVALIVFTSITFAVSNIPEKKHAGTTAKTAVTLSAKKGKKVAKVKLVDINRAGMPELMTLPGISKAYADKIIAGRPYGSKAQMKSKGMVPDGVYQGISALVVAKQPFADSTKNAEALGKAKQK